jgi:nucleoside-diphosphate-sugar epimerase
MKKHTILVTGCAGNVGSVLARHLLHEGHRVVGFDCLMFGDSSLVPLRASERFTFLEGDLRDEHAVDRALEGVQVVVHLAAIVGDPACAADEKLATQVNHDASLLFMSKARARGVERFVFASTCSNYGKMEGGAFVRETSPLRPVSHYARLKVAVEQCILQSDRHEKFVPTSLRLATVYGISLRTRFDLTVNEFVKELALGRELVVFGEQFWRPYCHVEDVVRACRMVIDAPREQVDREVFNVGSTAENYQKKMIVEEILKKIPGARIRYVRKEEDPRDYRVDFSKINDVLGFRHTKTVPDGIAEILEFVLARPNEDFEDQKYHNVIQRRLSV